MMRSVRNIIDKADWEPLVADVLQANVRGGLLSLARLASAASGVALRRIMNAANAEVIRQIKSGNLPATLKILVESETFMQAINNGLETFCRSKVERCANEMKDAVFELTHAVHFEMIDDFFQGCLNFEDEFIQTPPVMESVVRSVSMNLAARKKQLSATDIFSRNPSSTNSSVELIYKQVSIQFWAVKMLLAAPLTAKLYMHFVKDIKDKSQHLASEGPFKYTSENDLEVALQNATLFQSSVDTFDFDIGGPSEPTSSFREDLTTPMTEEELMQLYEANLGKEMLLSEINKNKDLLRFLMIMKRCINKFCQRYNEGMQIDFLTEME